MDSEATLQSFETARLIITWLFSVVIVGTMIIVIPLPNDLASGETAIVNRRNAPKAVKVPSFLSLRRHFVQFCELLDGDGRRGELEKFIHRKQGENPLCRYCESFFKNFSKACAIRGRKRDRSKRSLNTEGEESNSSEQIAQRDPAKQRLPKLAVISVFAELLERLGSIAQADEELAALLLVLSTELSECQGISEGACDYYRTLSSLIRGRLEGLETRGESSERPGGKDSGESVVEPVDPSSIFDGF